MLQPQRIAQTIVKLQQAGKRMPQDIRPGFDRLEEAKRILSETVNLWAGIFNQQNIGLDRWEKAEQIALTLTGANGLNVNIISPALMQAALKQAETEHVEATISRNEEAKKERPANYADTKEGRSNAKLLRWTLSRMRQGRVFGPYWPTAKEVADMAEQIGMTANDVDNYNQLLLRIFLNDVNYGKEHPEFILDYIPYFDKRREVSFRKVA